MYDSSVEGDDPVDADDPRKCCNVVDVDNESAPGQSLACPRCGAPFRLDPSEFDADGNVTCVCGHRAYAGYIAEASANKARLDWLTARIEASDPAPNPELARQYGVWPAPIAQPTPARRRSMTTQNLLLSLGAALLVVAGTVFAAVNWRRLGAIGQVVLLGGATIGLAALAVKLRARLGATAEAVAVVAFGLAVVDVVGAPALSLVPERWLDADQFYLPVAFAALSLLALIGARRFALRAWTWLGWMSVVVTAIMLTRVVGERAGDSPTTWAAAFGLTAVTGVALLSEAERSGETARRAKAYSGGCAVVIAVLVSSGAALERDALVGATISVLATAAALAVAALIAGDWRRQLTWGAGLAASLALALVCALPSDPQPIWLGPVVGLAGAIALLALTRIDDARSGFVVAMVTWGAWSVFRIAAALSDDVADEIVRQQIGWVTGVAALWMFVVAYVSTADARGRHLGWAAAVSAETSLLLWHPGWAPDVLETWTLPLAVALAAAGLLATRTGPSHSLVRWGPMLSAGLIPSAVACWSAPWVGEGTGEATEFVIRLAFVVAVGSGFLVVGAIRMQGGLLFPSASAVGIAAGAQLWSSTAALPRWIVLAIAGSALVATGARLEWLGLQRSRVSSWLHRLDR